MLFYVRAFSQGLIAGELFAGCQHPGLCGSHGRLHSVNLLLGAVSYTHLDVYKRQMYASVLLGAAALVALSDPVFAWPVWMALALVLWQKLVLEERWMREHHPNYGASCRVSKRLVPWIF